MRRVLSFVFLTCVVSVSKLKDDLVGFLRDPSHLVRYSAASSLDVLFVDSDANRSPLESEKQKEMFAKLCDILKDYHRVSRFHDDVSRKKIFVMKGSAGAGGGLRRIGQLLCLRSTCVEPSPVGQLGASKGRLIQHDFVRQ